MSTNKYADVKLGFVEAVLNKLGGIVGAERFLRGEVVVSERVQSWFELNGVIYFSVVSDGTTGWAWITRLEKDGNPVGRFAANLLRSGKFQPTTGVLYQIAVLKGKLFGDSDRNTKNICKLANDHKLIVPQIEIACLIRDKFTDAEIEAMGLSDIFVMHEPYEDSEGYLRRLRVNCHNGKPCLGSYCDSPEFCWHSNVGFAFLVSQVNPV